MDSRIVVFFILLFAVFGYLFQNRDPAAPVKGDLPGRGIAVITTATPKKSMPRDQAFPQVPATIPSPPLTPVAVMPTDTCGWIRAVHDGKNFQKEIQSLLQQFEGRLSATDNQTLQWLFEVPDRKADVEESTALLFLKGLEESGMLLGRGSPRRLNVGNSVALLEKAQAQDSGNGALDLYLAALYQRQGRWTDALEAIRRGLQKDRFDIYMTDISKKLLSAPKSSIEFLKAVQLFSSMPIPDMNPLRESLLGLTNSEDFAPDIYRFAQTIVDEAVGSRTPYNHLDWWLSSYVMAGHLLQRRGQAIPRPFDLHQEFNEFPEVSEITDTAVSCDAVAIERSIQRFQSLIRPVTQTLIQTVIRRPAVQSGTRAQIPVRPASIPR